MLIQYYYSAHGICTVSVDYCSFLPESSAKEMLVKVPSSSSTDNSILLLFFKVLETCIKHGSCQPFFSVHVTSLVKSLMSPTHRCYLILLATTHVLLCMISHLNLELFSGNCWTRRLLSSICCFFSSFSDATACFKALMLTITKLENILIFCLCYVFYCSQTCYVQLKHFNNSVWKGRS